MQYRIVNLDTEIARDLMKELGDKVVKGVKFHDGGCLDMLIDPELSILKIRDGAITIDVSARLFTISHNQYSRLEII